MRNYAIVLQKQTDIVFIDIDYTLSFIDMNYWDKRVNGYVVWKQIYHMLNSIDRIFTVPENYTYPDFHVEGLNSLDKTSDVKLGKDILYKYFNEIKGRVISYLEWIDDEVLLEKIICQEMKLTRFDLILAQIRHITWHLGYIHSCIKSETGLLPTYVGVNKEFFPIG